jgi:hypothetical protein
MRTRVVEDGKDTALFSTLKKFNSSRIVRLQMSILNITKASLKQRKKQKIL